MLHGFIFKTAALVLTFVASANAKLETVKLMHPSGSTAEVALFGAHVMSFRAAMDPKLDILFMSKKSFMDGVQPISGGIPIVFPNFGGRKGFPNHGFARITTWTFGSYVESTGKDVPSVATFTMASSSVTREIWPVEFKLEYEVKLYANQLETALLVQNTFTEKIEFNALLHNYLWVDDVRNKGVRVKGLKGIDYFDKVDQLNKTEANEFIDITVQTDNVYKNVPNAVSAVIKGVNNVDRTVKVKKVGLINGAHSESKVKTDVVVWNPWMERAKTMTDFDAEEYKNMVAIEPGRVSEMQPLSAGKSYTLQQTISVYTL